MDETPLINTAVKTKVQKIVDAYQADPGVSTAEVARQLKAGKTMAACVRVVITRGTEDEVHQMLTGERSPLALARAIQKRAPLPPGNKRYHWYNKSIINDVKAGMEAHPHNIDKAAKVAGIWAGYYSIIRKLIILSEQHINGEDKKLIEDLLLRAESKEGLPRIRHEADPLIKKYWRRGGKDPAAAKRMMRLEKTLNIIGEGCAATEDIEVPRELTPAMVEAAEKNLRVSIGQLCKFIVRIKKGEIPHEQD